MFQVVQPYVVLILPSSLLDLFHQGGNRGAKINKQVGRLDQGAHEVEQGKIVFEVPGAH